jgi:serine/threonine protein kinase
MLGKGGAGEVYLAYDTSLNRWVAIKRIPATDSDLIQEATVLASFQHPNIVTVHDVILEGGEMLLVMEFVQGQTLEELADGRGNFPGFRCAVPRRSRRSS